MVRSALRSASAEFLFRSLRKTIFPKDSGPCHVGYIVPAQRFLTAVKSPGTDPITRLRTKVGQLLEVAQM